LENIKNVYELYLYLKIKHNAINVYENTWYVFDASAVAVVVAICRAVDMLSSSSQRLPRSTRYQHNVALCTVIGVARG